MQNFAGIAKVYKDLIISTIVDYYADNQIYKGL